MATGDESKLFVAGLPEGLTEDTLRELFTRTGARVEELSMPRDRMTGRPRGFAFVRLSSREQCDAARAQLDGTFIEGRSISVRPFSAEPPARGVGAPAGPGGGGFDRPRPPMGGGFAGASGGGGGGFDRPRPMGGGPPDTSDRTIYLGNLPYDCSEQEVKDLFSTAGASAPARIHLPMDPDGRRRGFGFITMESPEAAQTSVTHLGEAQMRNRRLVVNIAHPKGDKPARPERSFGGGGGGGFGGGGGGGFGGGGGGFGGAPPGGNTGGRVFTDPPAPPKGEKRRVFSSTEDGEGRYSQKGNKKRRPTTPKNADAKRGRGWGEDEDF